MSNGSDNCTQCRFFSPGLTPNGFPGECRRYPPRQHTHGNDQYAYAEVDRNLWCGEFKKAGSGNA